MLEQLGQFDSWLFRLINIQAANPVTDRVMPFITDGEHWVLAVVLAACVLVYAKGWRSVPILLGVAIVFAACDQTSAHLIKPLADRIRPCNVIPDVHLLVGCSNARSFPSAHATNTFGCAVFLAWALPRWRWTFFAVAFVVSMSRIFVGVHYPFDVVGGWFLGGLIGACVAYGFRLIRHAREARP